MYITEPPPCTGKLRALLCFVSYTLKDKSGVDKIIVKKQPYQVLNTSCEFFPGFHASNIHKFDD